MMSKKFSILSVLAAAALGGSACAPTVRYLTAENWDLDNKNYVVITSWQNTGGSKGESKVESCIIAENNGLSCKNQAQAEAALNVRGRGKGKSEATKTAEKQAKQDAKAAPKAEAKPAEAAAGAPAAPAEEKK